MIKIISFIIENKLTLFIPIFLLIIILMISSFDKVKRVPWLGFSFSIIAILSFITTFFIKNLKILNIDILFFICGFSIVTLIIDIVIFINRDLHFRKLIKLITYTPSNIESNIYSYLDDKSRVVMFTEQFFNLFTKEKIKYKIIKQMIKNIVCDEKHFSIKEFEEYLRKFEERSYSIRYILVNNKEIKLELLKRKVTSNGKLLGYILYNQKLTPNEVYKDSVAKDFKKQFNMYLELLDEAVCYYDIERNKYILSKSMVRLLGVNENEIDEKTFEKYVMSDDYKTILKRTYIQDNTSKLIYRMNTTNGFNWFEENTINFNSINFLIIHQSDLSNFKYNFKDYILLINEIMKIYEQKRDCSILIFSFNEIYKINEKIGKDGSEVVISKFFTKLNETIPTEKIYRIGLKEFCILIDKNEVYEFVLRDLNNNSSILLGTNINFNETKYDIKTSIGLVESKNVEKTKPELLIKAGFEALSYATNDQYPKRYSIYYPKKPISINFENVEIDLSDQFLDKILNENK